MSRSLDLTGSNWGLRKRHEDRHIEKYDVRWVLHFWWEMWRPPLSSSAFIYTQVWESRMKCSSSSHGSSCIAGGTAQLWYVVIYWRLYWLHQHVLFSLQGSLAEPCLPLAGSMPIAKNPFDRAMLMPRSISTASVSLLASCQCLVFLAQRTLTWTCTCQSFFSVYVVTGLPHLLPLYFLNILSADWCLVQGVVFGLFSIWLKKYKSRLVAKFLFP
jgi:hypothetical protein